MEIETINPATGKPISKYKVDSPEEIEFKLKAAETFFRSWRQTSFKERTAPLKEAGSLLRSNKQELARVMTEEMGKPIVEAEAEIEKCAFCCEFNADHAEEFLATEAVSSDARESFVRYDPLGPILAIMPWNFPFWQVFRFCAPALAAGNIGLLKHASNVPGCALAIQDLLREAGFPPEAFQTLLVPSSAMEPLLADPRVRAVTLTGSDAAGSRVAEVAGRSIKKTVLELGGSDPFVVLEDANVEEAARVGTFARTFNCGQSCINAKRFIVHEKHLEVFEKLFTEETLRLRVGDPMDRQTQVGPLAREDILQDLASQVERTISRGARLLCGGKRLDRPGFFHEPTVLAGVRKGMPAFDEETFGPVAAIVAARSDDEAVELANQSPYGLGASLWTEDMEKGKELAARIEAGVVFVNGFVKSDPRLPFGGVKRSGYGRELSRHGIQEFMNIKTVWIA